MHLTLVDVEKDFGTVMTYDIFYLIGKRYKWFKTTLLGLLSFIIIVANVLLLGYEMAPPSECVRDCYHDNPTPFITFRFGNIGL